MFFVGVVFVQSLFKGQQNMSPSLALDHILSMTTAANALVSDIVNLLD